MHSGIIHPLRVYYWLYKKVLNVPNGEQSWRILHCLYLEGYLGSYSMGQSPCYKVPFREGRGIMKSLDVIWASEADGLSQCLLVTFSPASIVRLSGFGFRWVA